MYCVSLSVYCYMVILCDFRSTVNRGDSLCLLSILIVLSEARHMISLGEEQKRSLHTYHYIWIARSPYIFGNAHIFTVASRMSLLHTLKLLSTKWF